MHRIDRKIEELSFMPSKIESMKKEIDEHVSKPHTAPAVEKRLDEVQEKLKTIVVKKSPKDKLIEKVAKSSHDYLKAMVLSYIKKYGKISAFQLREMVVDEQNLTSKSSFYRILEEIEKEEQDITILREGKEKVYLPNLKKPAQNGQ
jgi:hypothetical protein